MKSAQVPDELNTPISIASQSDLGICATSNLDTSDIEIEM
jgi:hypothetical protein